MIHQSASESLQKLSAPITCPQHYEVWFYAPAICTDEQLRGMCHTMTPQERGQVLCCIDEEITIEPHEPVVAALIKNQLQGVSLEQKVEAPEAPRIQAAIYMLKANKG